MMDKSMRATEPNDASHTVDDSEYHPAQWWDGEHWKPLFEQEGRVHSWLDFAIGMLMSSIIWFAILLWLVEL